MINGVGIASSAANRRAGGYGGCCASRAVYLFRRLFYILIYILCSF